MLWKKIIFVALRSVLRDSFFVSDGVTWPAVPLVATRRKSVQAVSATNKNLTLTDSSSAEKLNVLSFEAENRLHYKNYAYSTLVVLWWLFSPPNEK